MADEMKPAKLPGERWRGKNALGHTIAVSMHAEGYPLASRWDGSRWMACFNDSEGAVFAAWALDTEARASAAEALAAGLERDAAKLNAEGVAAGVRARTAERRADVAAGVQREAPHQRERWGSEHDARKTPADWFWLIGYLGGKALHAHIAGNTEKALRHTITAAAALCNWHAAILGKTDMRPGTAEPAESSAVPPIASPPYPPGVLWTGKDEGMPVCVAPAPDSEGRVHGWYLVDGAWKVNLDGQGRPTASWARSMRAWALHERAVAAAERALRIAVDAWVDGKGSTQACKEAEGKLRALGVEL